MTDPTLEYLAQIGQQPADNQAASLMSLAPMIVGSRTWVPVAPDVVSRLVDLAKNPESGARALALRLATEVLCGSHQSQLRTGYCPGVGVLADPVASATYELACRRAPEVLGFADDADPELRVAVAFYVSFLPAVAEQAAPTLRACWDREPESEVRASLMVALGLVQRSLGELELPAIEEGAPLAERAAALAAKLYVGGPVESAELESILQSALEARPELPLALFPYWRGQPEGLLGAAAGAHPDPAVHKTVANQLADAAVSAIQAGSADGRACSWAMSSAALVFEPQSRPLLLEEISEPARSLVSKLTRVQDAFDYSFFGLPPTRRDRLRWLGESPPGILERVVPRPDGEGEAPIWWVMQKYHFDGDTDEGPRWAKSILSLEDFVDCLVELHAAAYGMRTCREFSVGDFIDEVSGEWCKARLDRLLEENPPGTTVPRVWLLARWLEASGADSIPEGYRKLVGFWGGGMERAAHTLLSLLDESELANLFDEALASTRRVDVQRAAAFVDLAPERLGAFLSWFEKDLEERGRNDHRLVLALQVGAKRSLAVRKELEAWLEAHPNAV